MDENVLPRLNALGLEFKSCSCRPDKYKPGTMQVAMNYNWVFWKGIWYKYSRLSMLMLISYFELCETVEDVDDFIKELIEKHDLDYE